MDSKPDQPAHDQAIKLASEAISLARSGRLADAGRRLDEAAKLSPENEKVNATREELRKYEDGRLLVELCQQYREAESEDVGEEALDYLHKHKLSDSVAEEAMKVFLEFRSDRDMADQITGELLKHRGARQALTTAIIEQPTATFKKLFDRGEDTMDGIMSVLRLQSEWKDQAIRVVAIRDIFQLALASMMEAGLDNPDRAMKLIASLLSYEASHLHGLIDADGFDVILSALDIRLHTRIKKYATLATAKLLEASPDSAKVLVTNYVTSRIRHPTADGLVLAFSASAAVFPMEPTNAAALFLSDDFLPSFVPLVQEMHTSRVEQSALELLSAACMDKGCREGIVNHCKAWLWEVAEANVDVWRSNLAALILVKISDASAMTSGGELVGLIEKFKSTVIEPARPGAVEAIEALAFASLNPEVKEDLASEEFLAAMVLKLRASGQAIRPAQFGGVSILENLTTYTPPMSEEQKKMSDLKAYANNSKPIEPSPLESKEKVTIRCRKVLESGAIPLLSVMSKGASPGILLRICRIFLSLSQEQRHRGVLAQQGAVKQLLTIYDGVYAVQRAKPLQSTTVNLYDILYTAAHAASRILISVDPQHVFTATLPLPTAVPPLASLLTTTPSSAPTSTPPTHLPTFEALLAITNLASTSDSARDIIIRHTFPAVDDLLLLTAQPLIVRAATELVCNLMASASGVALFAEPARDPQTRLRILVALTDAGDLPTRKAAGGALAMILEWQQGVEAVLEQPKGVTRIVAMCVDESAEVGIRGLACAANIAQVPGELGAKGRALLRELKLGETLERIIKEGRGRELGMVDMAEGVQQLLLA